MFTRQHVNAAETLLSSISSFGDLEMDVLCFAGRSNTRVPTTASGTYLVLALNALKMSPNTREAASTLLDFLLTDEGLNTMLEAMKTRCQQKAARCASTVSGPAGLCHLLNAIKEFDHV